MTTTQRNALEIAEDEIVSKIETDAECTGPDPIAWQAKQISY